MEAWNPEYPEESIEILEELTKKTESDWDFYYSPGGTADSLKEIKRREVSETAINKIKKEMDEEKIEDGEAKTITPGIDWKGRGEGQELSYTPIQYRADYAAFEKSRL